MHGRPGDVDQGWSVEIRIPWRAWTSAGRAPGPLVAGCHWRIGFSRVDWPVEVVDGGYRKRSGQAEENWVWSAPTDTWDLWHRSGIDVFYDRLIEDMSVFEDVDPDRVYLLGYSAGGDGVYEVAPRMADRFAAAAMMAGHLNETFPLGLRNLPFAIQVGAKDGGYNRNAVARGRRLEAGRRGARPVVLAVRRSNAGCATRGDPRLMFCGRVTVTRPAK